MLKLVMECVKWASGKSSFSDFITMPFIRSELPDAIMVDLNASIIPGTMSVAMILGCSSGSKFLRMTLVAVPGPLALSWMIELLEIGARWPVIWAKRLRVLFPV